MENRREVKKKFHFSGGLLNPCILHNFKSFLACIHFSNSVTSVHLFWNHLDEISQPINYALHKSLAWKRVFCANWNTFNEHGVAFYLYNVPICFLTHSQSVLVVLVWSIAFQRCTWTTTRLTKLCRPLHCNKKTLFFLNQSKANVEVNETKVFQLYKLNF